MKHNYLFYWFAVLLCLTVPAQSFATIYNGSCGESVNWRLDTETGLLEITGSGEIAGYSSGDAPWYNCRTNIKECVIENGVTSIGDYAFYGCTGLTSITIPESVTSIGDYAFEYCTGLTSVTIGNSVTSIERCAFYGCTGLTSITIGNSVIFIGYSAFEGCTGLTSITWKAISCTSSSFSPFNGIKENITSFTFGDKVQTIPANLCSGMSNLNSITIPESVTSIGSSAFEDCTGLTSITWNAISCTSFSSSTFNGIKENITSFTFGDKVQTIPANLCSGMSNLTNITIGNSVTSIGDYAFRNCTGLTSITIPESVTSIGSDAFYGTPWLNNQSDGLIYIGKVCYDYKGEMPESTTIIIKEGTTSIGYSAFRGCTGLTSITIPESVTSIGENAFEDCTGLTNITIPESVTSIGEYAFKNCTGLTSITWNAISCTSFSSSTFNGIKENITSFTFGDKVQTIPANLCSGMSNLNSITIPESVTSIGEYAFKNSSGLTSITWNAISCTSFSSSTFNGIKENITSFTFGDKVQTIPAEICSGMSNLTNITIPESVTSIGDYAFRNCTGLTGVIMGEGVTSIGPGAFVKNSNLVSVTCYSQTSPEAVLTGIVQRRTFYGISKEAILYYPKGSDYSAWAPFFAQMIEMDETDIDTPRADDGKDTTYDIYDMNGRTVRKAATTTDGLKAGLYIINGRKVLVK